MKKYISKQTLNLETGKETVEYKKDIPKAEKEVGCVSRTIYNVSTGTTTIVDPAPDALRKISVDIYSKEISDK